MRRSNAKFYRKVACRVTQDLLPTPNDSHVTEIPGFYYDATKKRYFKVCKEHPKPSLIEQHHKEELGSCTLPVNRKPQNFAVECILKRQYSANYPDNFRRKILEKLVKQMKSRQSMQLNPFTVTSEGHYTRVSLERIESDLMAERILSVFSLPGYTPPDANIVLFSDVNKDHNKQVSLRVNSSMSRCQKTTAISWSPYKKSCNFYILSSLGSGNCSGEVSLYQIMECSQKFVAQFPVHRRSVWTTSWNRNPLYQDMISVGASKAAIIFDVNTKRQLTITKGFSDVLAQEFAVSSPILFCGQRDGWLVGIDLRNRATLAPIRIRHGAQLASITCIKLMNDENYLVSSGLDGTVKRWDVRMNRCVQEYRGHVNSITHCLPFYLDSTDTFLIAGGEDTVTRVWSVQSGEVIRTISSPENVVKAMSAVPALKYAEEWGGPGGFPGLMYGTNDTVRMYRL